MLIANFLSVALNAQNLGAYEYPVPAKYEQFNVDLKKENLSKSLQEFIEKKHNQAQLTFQLIDESSSIAGKHFTFGVLYQNIYIENALIKAHINQNGALYYYSYNLPNTNDWNVNLEREIKANYNDLKEITKVTQNQICIVINEFGLPQKGQKLTFVNTQQSIFLSRIYIDANTYFERDLRSFNDTIVTGKIFNPDPITTANTVYGGNYVNDLKRDTVAIVIQTIQNNQTSPLALDNETFNFNGQTFTVQAKNYTNSFNTSEIFRYFKELYFDVNGNLIGYETDITNDTLLETTQLIIEDFDFPELNNERHTVSVSASFDGVIFRLKNDFFEIADFSLPNIAPVTSFDGDFSFLRSQSGFEDFNAFYHLNNFRDYLESIGFTNSLWNKKVFVDTHANNGADNSFFTIYETYDTISLNPLQVDTSIIPALLFGNGGVDDAEDADVIMHEYAHVLSFLAAPFSNFGEERRALDEGFGDYLAASYSRSFSEYLWAEVFTWDGHNEYWSGRRADLERNFKDLDLAQNIYFNGEIWASMLMELWSELGRKTTDILAMQAMYYNMPQGTFEAAKNHLLLSDSILFDFENKCAIYNTLFNRKFTDKFCVAGQLTDSQSFVVLNSVGFMQGSSNATIIITQRDFEVADIVITDALGKKVLEHKNFTERSFSINPQSLANGVYYISIYINGNRFKTKLLKSAK